MWIRIPASKHGYGGTRASCPNYWVRTMLKSMLVNKDFLTSLIARSMAPTWGPSGANRTKVGPMLAPWSLLSGIPHIFQHILYSCLLCAITPYHFILSKSVDWIKYHYHYHHSIFYVVPSDPLTTTWYLKSPWGLNVYFSKGVRCL